MAAAEPHALVDVLAARKAVLVHAHAGHEVGDEQHVDDEARAVLGADRVLAELAREGLGALDHGGVGVERDHHLDQLHHRHGREEVQAEHALRVVGPGGELGDRDRGRVRGEDHVLAEPAVKRLEDLPLERRVLDHGLDHELGVAERVRVGRPLDALHERGRLLVGQLAAADRPRNRGLDSPARALERRRVGLVQLDLDTGASGGLSDARTHEARADDGDGAHLVGHGRDVIRACSACGSGTP